MLVTSSSRAARAPAFVTRGSHVSAAAFPFLRGCRNPTPDVQGEEDRDNCHPVAAVCLRRPWEDAAPGREQRGNRGLQALH